MLIPVCGVALAIPGEILAIPRLVPVISARSR